MIKFYKHYCFVVIVVCFGLLTCAVNAGNTRLNKARIAGRQCLVMSNGQTEFSVDAQRFMLTGIRDVKQRINYVLEPGGSLFNILLNQPPYESWQSRKTYSIDGSSAEKCTYEFINRDSGGVLVLHFLSCRIGEFGQGADVTVSITLGNDDPILHFGLQVNNTSGVPLFSVRFPTLQGLGSSLKGSENTDYYLGSYCSSYKIMKPRESLGFGEGFGNYPGNGITVQLHCYSDGMNKGSLYLAVEDITRSRKAFSAEPMKSKKAFGWNIMYYHDGETDKSGNWKLPFNVAVGPIQGDWYDAAKIYRKWALASKIITPLRERTDIPAWFYDTSTVLEAVFRGEKPENMDTVADNMLKTRQALGEDYIVHAYKWYKNADEDDRCPPDYHAKDGFKEAVARLKAGGVHVMPYMNLSLFDMKTEKWKNDKPEQWVNRNEDGTMTDRGGTEPYFHDVHMCSTTDYWQNTMVDLAKYIINDVGADSLYLDEVHVHPWLCYATNHKHKAPGGNYLTTSYRNIIDRMRVETGKPDLVLMGECETEAYADKISSSLVGHYDFDPFSAPMLQAVMHDSMIEVGMGVLRPEAESMDMWAAKQGLCFLRGKQFGWLVAGDIFSPWTPELAPQMKYLHALGDCRRACKEFVIFGDFLREPDMSANPVHEVGWSQVWPTHPKPIKLPNVLADAYKAVDGSIGLVLVNITADPQVVEIPINAKDWSLKPGVEYDMSTWQNGAWSAIEKTKLSRTLKVTVPAYSPSVIKLQEAR